MEKTVKPLNFETYLSLIQGSVGTRAYQKLWAKVGSQKKNVVRDGGLSCAFFASFILSGFNFIKGIHATVGGTVRDLEASGWEKIDRPVVGSVLVWEAKEQNSGIHSHIGFCVGKNAAVSNHPTRGVPAEHHITFGVKNGKPVRRIVAIYFKKDLK